MITGFSLTYKVGDSIEETNLYLWYSKNLNKKTMYRNLLTWIAKIYDIDPVFFYDEEAIFIILDNIPLPTYEDFCYELDERLTRKIVDTKENITIVYTLFDGIMVD